MSFRDEAMLLCAMMRELSEKTTDPLSTAFNTRPHEDKWMHIFKPQWGMPEFASKILMPYPHNYFIAPLQFQFECSELVELISSLKPRAILEIGTYAGGTLFLFAQVASPDAIIISVDLPNGYPSWRSLLYKAFVRHKTQRVYTIRRNSHDVRTLETVKFLLKGRPVDFLFIDGDHSYEGVKKDFEMYSPLVRKGGIIAFHDIEVQPCDICDVITFWNEIKHEYKYKEITEARGLGIGVLFV